MTESNEFIKPRFKIGDKVTVSPLVSSEGYKDAKWWKVQLIGAVGVVIEEDVVPWVCFDTMPSLQDLDYAGNHECRNQALQDKWVKGSMYAITEMDLILVERAS